MEFSVGCEEVFAIKKEIDLFSTALDFGDVLTKLKGVFENKSMTKITNSSKTDKKILKKCERYVHKAHLQCTLYRTVQFLFRQEPYLSSDH